MEIDVGVACSTRGIEIHNKFLVREPEVTSRNIQTPMRGRIKLDLEEIGRDGMDCIHLAQDRDERRAVVNTAINLHVHKMLGIS
jgi:hypothetical protein